MERFRFTEPQRAVIRYGALLMFAMWLFPPWHAMNVTHATVASPGQLFPATDAGYSWLFHPPGGPHDLLGRTGVHPLSETSWYKAVILGGPYQRATGFGVSTLYWVNWGRLCLQWLVVFLLVAVAMVMLRERRAGAGPEAADADSYAARDIETPT